jgi:hypothetical protein
MRSAAASVSRIACSLGRGVAIPCLSSRRVQGPEAESMYSHNITMKTRL